MGIGGFLTLINLTPYTWLETGYHSYQLSHWDDTFPSNVTPCEILPKLALPSLTSSLLSSFGAVCVHRGGDGLDADHF